MNKYLFAFGVVAAAAMLRLQDIDGGEQPQIVREVACEQKCAALTIDDGPYPGSTEKLLQALTEQKIKATFFILGENAAEYPDLLKKIREAGHEIASHSFTHRHLTKLSAAECRREFRQAAQVLGDVELFRPPGGLYDDKVLEEAEEYGYRVVLWSIDTLDWQKPPVEQVVHTVMANIKSGSIILLHDGQANLPTPQAIHIFVGKLKKEGYVFKTVGELLAEEKW